MTLQQEIKPLKQLLKKEQYEEAITIGKPLLDKFPDEIELLLALAQAYIGTTNYSRAEYYLISAKMQNPKHVETLLLLGTLQVILQQHIAAQEYYNAVLAIEPKNILAQIAIADLLYVDGLYEAATVAYRKALEQHAHQKLTAENFATIIYKVTSSYLNSGALEDAEEFLNQYAPKAFQEMVELVKRKLYIAQKEQEKVLETTELLHKKVPQQPKYIFELIQLLDPDKDSSRLLDLYTKVLELELDIEEVSRALLGRASIKLNEGDAAGSVQDLSKLIANNESWFAYQQRAIAQEANKDKKAALQDWTKAIKLIEEPYAPLHQSRGELLLRAGAYEKSIPDFKQVIQLSEDGDATAYYNLGMAYNKMGDKTMAFKMLVQSEMMGYEKARTLLLKSFGKQLGKIRQKKSAEFAPKFEAEVARNQKSPILQAAFGQLWVADMPKFIQTIEEEMDTYPASVMRDVLAETAKDLFLITPNGILFIEGSGEPLEAYYSVEVESEHSILLNLQPTKGGKTTGMRLSRYEQNLMITYPVGEMEVPAKYYLPTAVLTDEQRSRLVAKDLDIPYLVAIEESIEQLLQVAN